LAPAALAQATQATQDTLHLTQMEEAAQGGDPRVKQRELLRNASDLRVGVITSDRLPDLSINGFGSHQSDVTKPVLGPGLLFPDLPKDRWQTTLDISQRLYDGGDVARRREVEQAREAESQAGVDVALYQLRSDVNSAFFSAVLLDQSAKEFETL